MQLAGKGSFLMSFSVEQAAASAEASGDVVEVAHTGPHKVLKNNTDVEAVRLCPYQKNHSNVSIFQTK